MKITVIGMKWMLAACTAVSWTVVAAAERKPAPPPLPILSPTALTADPGDGRVYLRWNPQIEDDRVVGWRVLQRAPETRSMNDKPLTESAMTVFGLSNGVRYTFAVVGVLKSGKQTPLSYPVTVTPREVGVARIETGRPTVSFGVFTNVPLREAVVGVVFPDGQRLVYGDYRPVDWTARDGVHLLYPMPFGNGLDIGRFDKRGLAAIIPPDGLDKTPPFTTTEGHAPSEPLNPDYRDLQHGTRHPHITDPMTLPMSKASNDARPRWFEPVVDGNRITFHYLQSIALMGYRSWTSVEVWETWWPIERDRHGARYHGLARFVEVCMPSVHKDGYQVMLNNGFGPDGSRQGVVSYNTGFRGPACEVVDFSGAENRQVYFQGFRPARHGYGYHPNGNSLQASPLIFYDWGRGSLTIAARSLCYHGANNSASYVEQGADGVWPNLAWDLAASGRRTPVETVEYLYAADVRQPLPQRFINARMETFQNVSRRMGVQDGLGGVALVSPHNEIVRRGGPEASADTWIKELAGTGVDVVGMWHDTWQANPDTVSPEYFLNETFRFNPELKRMNAKFAAAGLHPGFWFRPEFCKTSLPTGLSSPLLPLEQHYHSIEWMSYPVPGETLIATEKALPVIRDHPNWIRRQRDGAWPQSTPYNWIPMSLASGWWDEIMWPALAMSARLGFDRVLTDGGFGGMQGVDYAPVLDGRTDTAVPCQPFWWRYFRTLQHLGIRQTGECTGGWVGANTSVGGPTDIHHLWMLQMGTIIFPDQFLTTPADLHRAYQLYNECNTLAPGRFAAVRRHAVRFYATHRAPDWIELRDLREGEPVEVVATNGAYAGLPKPVTPEAPCRYTVRPWTWREAVWHYDDGTQAVFPAYDQIDWSKE
jgi:hypothetical protein